MSKIIWTCVAILLMFVPYKLKSSGQFFSAQFLLICTHVIDYHYVSAIAKRVLKEYEKCSDRQSAVKAYKSIGYVAEVFYWILVVVAILGVVNLLTLSGNDTFRSCLIGFKFMSQVRIPLPGFMVFELVSIVIIDTYVNGINSIRMKEGRKND